jgi:hypothetical protein
MLAGSLVDNSLDGEKIISCMDADAQQVEELGNEKTWGGSNLADIRGRIAVGFAGQRCG